jgi:UDP-N-acetylmuramate: L-alanyl-gamma-D-glutamyl-meso-diaminopimelate ligase
MFKIHLIAIGGSIMHNLALALQNCGYAVSGSDDQIFEPAKSRLANAGLLPSQEGWHPEFIINNLDLVILGMHAKKDNPELLKAIELGIPVQSFPEYIAQEYKSKKQIVVTGSHGKTTTSAMLIHVFKECGLSFDFLVGAQLEGFQNMVTISDAQYAIIEGDEYLSSCIDPRPKFLHYNPFINIITGIAWDHYNVFPTYKSYLHAFEEGVSAIKNNHHVVYYENDKDLKRIISVHGNHLIKHPYHEANYEMENGVVHLIINNKKYPLQIFGKHNMQNMQAVLETCKIMGLDLDQVAQALCSFKGAAKRMELISENQMQIRYRDFAHAPSKVLATVEAIRERYPDKRILIVLELHTYSSLNKAFIPQYKNSVNLADKVIVYFDQRALEIKRMPSLDPDFVKTAFNNDSLVVVNKIQDLRSLIDQFQIDFQVILFLGSGQFGGIDLLAI